MNPSIGKDVYLFAEDGEEFIGYRSFSQFFTQNGRLVVKKIIKWKEIGEETWKNIQYPL